MSVATLAIRNRVRQFVEDRGITIYRLREDTKISNTTVYALANNPEQIPDAGTMDAICRAYGCQPGELLEYVAE